MDIYATILPVITMLLLGLFAKKAKLITKEGVAGLKGFVVNFTMPAVLFSALCTVKFNLSVLAVVVLMFAICVAAFFVGKLISKLFAAHQALIPFMTTGFEAGMMGYALFSTLYGAQNVGYFAVVDIGQMVFVFTLYLGLLNAKEGLSRSHTLKNMFKTPAFLAILAGLFFNLSGLAGLVLGTGAGSVAMGVINYIAAPTGCVILFAVGYELAFTRSAMRSAVLVSAARLVIMAGLCAVFILLSNLIFAGDAAYREFIPKAALLMFSLPAPFVLPIYAKDEDDVCFSATYLSLYTLISILFFIVLVLV